MTLPESDWCSLGLLTYDTLKVSTLKQGSFILVCASNQNSCAVTLRLPQNTLNTIYFTGSCSPVSKLFSSPVTCYFISFVFSQAGRPSQAWCLCFYSWSEKTLGGTKSQVTGSSQEVNAGVILSKEPSFCLYIHKKKNKKNETWLSEYLHTGRSFPNCPFSVTLKCFWHVNVRPKCREKAENYSSDQAFEVFLNMLNCFGSIFQLRATNTAAAHSRS